MRSKFLAAAVATTIASTACAQPATPRTAPPGAPKLIVAISVDQFSADLFDQYRPHFTAGLKRLSSGTAFRNGYQAQSATETCPGHSTILTGTYPARSGIIANGWVDQGAAREDKAIYCAEDERVPGTTSVAYTASPYHLLVPTLGELMKTAYPGSRNVAVSGKDRGAIMMTGHKVDQRWYWGPGKFVTDVQGAAVPQTLVRANQAIGKALLEDRQPLQSPSLCQGKAAPVPIENSENTVGSGLFARNAEDQNAFRASPEFDGAALAVAAGLVDEMQLGKRADPDVLAISLAATDYVGHAYGTQGQEMCLQLLALDRELGDFLNFLDARGIDYSVVLTADHGGQDVPERQRGAGQPAAARVDPKLNAGEIGLDLVNKLGLSGFGLYGEGSFGDMYVDRSLAEADRRKLLDAAVAVFRAHPQVEAVFTGDQLVATPVSTRPADQWSLIERARASYYPGRSGDFVVLLKKDITPISDTSRYVATHGSVWDYDRRVPILFWRRGMAASNRADVIETVDIMPTLAASIGLSVDARSIDGQCLGGIPGISCPSR